MNNATSSAYNYICCLILPPASGCNTPIFDALVNKLLSTSITNIKSMGDRGSPCRSPRWCLIDSPGSPLTRILVDVVESKLERRLRQESPNPKCFNTSKRNDHETESKVSEMSSFKKMLGVFFLCSSLIICCTSI